MNYDFRPLSPEVYEIVESTSECLTGEVWLGKGTQGPPLHIHPHSQENLEVLEGKVSVYENGKWQVIKKGEKRSIPPGEIHTFRTVPDSDARMNFSFLPAHNFEGFLKDTEHLIRSGKLTSYQNINGLIYSSMLVKKYKDALRASQLHMRIIMNLAVVAGVLLGKKI